MRNQIYSLLFLLSSLGLMSSGCKKGRRLTKKIQTDDNTFSNKVNRKRFLLQGGDHLLLDKVLLSYT
jgi:hypothetical protein